MKMWNVGLGKLNELPFLLPELTKEMKASAIGIALALLFALFYRSRTSKDLPVLNLWSVWFSVRKDTTLRSAISQALEAEKFKNHILIRVRLFPFFSAYMMKDPEGVKLFYSHPSLSLPDGYEWLLGSVRAKIFKGDHRKVERIDTVSILSKLLRPQNLSEWAGRILLPTITEKLAQQDTIENLMDFTYNTVSTMSVRTFTQATATKEQQERLVEGIREADIESMMQRNPWHAIIPNFYPLVRERERIYHKMISTVGEIITNYVNSHLDELNSMTTSKQREGPDLVSSLVKGIYDPKTQFLDLDYAIASVGGLVDAAVLNQYIATTLLLIHLNRNPEIKAKVVESLQPLADFLKANGLTKPGTACDSIAPALLEDLDLLDACLLESLRISSTGIVPRVASSDIEVESVTIPKGSVVLNSQLIIHHDEKVNEDSNTFNPYRFIKDGKCVGGNKLPEQFVGFGLGRHVCTGMKFASLQIKILCAVILCIYDLQFEKADYTFASVFAGLSKPTENVKVKLTPKA
ncbi:hypothetical protein HDV04_004009 [Boothiomyces sp. JEL0838]|nr:hypothetical protein HDV04_004009 [Boothiomyces sp. JEL0838]